MQLQFHKMSCPCLQKIKRGIQNQEQTQEIRLGDDMPDIGRVLGAWGQVLLRSKEWQTGNMQISGGVMAWVMYEPEDGSAVRWVNTWIPFQTKWDLPDTRHDGKIRAQCLLRGIDARSTSARRLMVRACVGVMAEAMLPGAFCRYTPEELPEDIQLLKNTYPFRLPQEAEEKPFELEEVLTLPSSAEKLQTLIRYELLPQILEWKVMGSKVVFRGVAVLHILYQGQDGVFYSWDFELPFSQYAEMEGDYDQDATAEITLAVTSLEVDADEEGNLIMKAGLTGQILVSDQNLVTVVEDAYSPTRQVSVQVEQQQVPVILQQQSHSIHAQQQIQQGVGRIADAVFYLDHPRLQQRDGGVETELSGVFSLLYYDQEGVLQGATSNWEGSTSLSADEGVQMEGRICSGGKILAESGNYADLQGDILVEFTGSTQQGIPMVTALELGEAIVPDPNRPSVILRKVGEDKLWDIAKRTGSTVEAIRKANDLEDEPQKHKILLIPIT